MMAIALCVAALVIIIPIWWRATSPPVIDRNDMRQWIAEQRKAGKL